MNEYWMKNRLHAIDLLGFNYIYYLKIEKGDSIVETLWIQCTEKTP